MDENLEFNYIQNSVNANNQIISALQYEMTTLLTLIRQKKDWIEQLQRTNFDLNLRLEGMNKDNKSLITYYKGD